MGQHTSPRTRERGEPAVLDVANERLVDRRTATRALAWLLLGATLLELVVVLMLPADGPRASLAGIAMAAVATGTGWLLLVLRNRLPRTTVPAVLGLATTLLTASLAVGEGPPGGLLFGYVWITLLAVYALPPREAGVQLAYAAAAHSAVALLVREPTAASLVQWGLTLATMALAAVVVVALRERVARLVAGLADATRRDPLTGLPNRRGFLELMDAEVERARRSSRPLALLVGDIDGLARVNDELGQEAGDDVVRRVAAVLSATKRRIDATARIGGEEFAVVLPDTDEHGAFVLADRLRRAVRDDTGAPAPTTLSFGVASLPEHAPSVEGLMHGCYHALATAKRLSGDRSVIYNPDLAGGLLDEDASQSMGGETHLAAVLVLAETLDMRDTGTARHSQTVGRYARLVARELELDDETVERLGLAGILHDVGKVGVADAVLRKPGPLDDDEWAEMRKHPELGARILQGANLDDISGWVLAHHERPDGRGYPQGLRGEEIPLPARVLAVADAYEAMTADRVYRNALTPAAACAELERCAGTQFDVAVVRAFLAALAHEQTLPPAGEACR